MANKRIKTPVICAEATPQIGPFLRHLRNKFGLTQAFIAEKISVSRPTLNKIESGKADISFIQAKKLADFYNIAITSLLTTKDSMQKDTRHSLLPSAEDATSTLPFTDFRMNLKEEITIYICIKLMAEPDFFEPELKIALFLVDVLSYQKLKHPLLGFNYIKNSSGPEPEDWQSYISAMISGGMLSKVNVPPHKYPELKLLPLRLPRLEILHGDELLLIDEIITSIKHKHGLELVEIYSGNKQFHDTEIYQRINIYE